MASPRPRRYSSLFDGNSQKLSYGLFRPFSSMCCPSDRDCGVAVEAYVFCPCMCFLIRCKMGPGPLRQGPPLPPSPSTSVPSSQANREAASLSERQQIGATPAISCCRAQEADALSPNRFSCYQQRGGCGGGGSRPGWFRLGVNL